MFDMFETIAEQSSGEESYQSSVSGDVFVISVGGSLIINDGGPDYAKINQIAGTLSSLHSSGKKIAIVVGGGKTARNYVDALRSFNANNFELDLLGIKVTRLNASLLISVMESAHNEVLTNIPDAKAIIDSGKIPVFGGLLPFFTTDAVGALLAEYLGASFINLTNVDGVYDANPSEFPDAKRFESLSYRQLISLISPYGSSPGQNVVLDLACCMILERSKIPAVVLDGNNAGNLSNYLNGYSFTGTVISSSDNPGFEIPQVGEREEGGHEEEEGPKRAPARRKRTKRSREGSDEINPDEIDF